jgi:hypothetical protein
MNWKINLFKTKTKIKMDEQNLQTNPVSQPVTSGVPSGTDAVSPSSQVPVEPTVPNVQEQPSNGQVASLGNQSPVVADNSLASGSFSPANLGNPPNSANLSPAPVSSVQQPVSNPASLNTGMGDTAPTQAMPVDISNPAPAQIPVSMMAERENTASPVLSSASSMGSENIDLSMDLNKTSDDLAGKSKKKVLIIGVVAVLGVILIAFAVYFIFLRSDDAEILSPSNKLGMEEENPPSVSLPFTEEELSEDLVEDSMSQEGLIEAPELLDVVDSIEVSAPPALNLMEENASSEELSDLETSGDVSESNSVKRISR